MYIMHVDTTIDFSTRIKGIYVSMSESLYIEVTYLKLFFIVTN